MQISFLFFSILNTIQKNNLVTTHPLHNLCINVVLLWCYDHVFILLQMPFLLYFLNCFVVIAKLSASPMLAKLQLCWAECSRISNQSSPSPPPTSDSVLQVNSLLVEIQFTGLDQGIFWVIGHSNDLVTWYDCHNDWTRLSPVLGYGSFRLPHENITVKYPLTDRAKRLKFKISLCMK